MSVHMKKRPIEVKIDGQSYKVPAERAMAILSLIKGDDFTPWRDVAKNELSKKPEAALALKGARLKEGLSQTTLADKVGIKQYNLSKMENGERPIGKEMARRLSKVLKVDYRIFL